MSEWYYHDPEQGRVGPFSVDEMRDRFRGRLIQRTTQVWRRGLPEWLPLLHIAPELGLATLALAAAAPPLTTPPVAAPGPAPSPTLAPADAPARTVPPAPVVPPAVPTASASAIPRAVPPTVPPAIPVAHDRAPASPAAPSPSRSDAPRGKYSRVPLREKKTLSRDAIAGIVIAAVAIPGVLLVASELRSTYRELTGGGDSMGRITARAGVLKRAVTRYALRTGTCPTHEDPKVVQLTSEVRRRTGTRVRFGATEGGCSFVMTFDDGDQALDGKTLRYEGYWQGGEFAWDCSGGTLPEDLRPYECQG